jgi:hypothetical protein
MSSDTESGNEGAPLDFDPNRQRTELRTERREVRTGYCRHRRVKVATDAPSLRCIDCGEQIDPYAYIRKIARRWEDLFWVQEAEPEIVKALLWIGGQEGGRLSVTRRRIEVSLEWGGKRIRRSRQRCGGRRGLVESLLSVTWSLKATLDWKRKRRTS